ncbi:ketopantoate reductase PanE/ApbA-domain-containing protein [Pseudomassariella vexata]|uniref:Ketopantoate reductase PanE/ApbA-domain-containing protein n=1 Tax=Pseudomassariella vexata TaxID=1141098 RepID=A0A1Y2E745_9PEZI|nr:ketopantoate reductase PanE/ApbA-domain-containing protein [Pseudomassariella vexata]ORY67371.1 ketopantoate reductase PanE/ApbA-domain-containing protein [Pseudomassariella vexata]
MDDYELMRVCTVGGNAVSAFLSWRLQATNACDVTLVWKSGYEAVHQYGISFKSETGSLERFKPRRVVRTPEEAANNKEGAFDYVILCIKALPDVYDLASVIDSVVTPQHTCVLINTTHTLGVEQTIEERFPTNVVLSLVSNAQITQLGTSEFEHKGSSEIWVGPANKNANIPPAIQDDMAQALAMTLSTGQVDCKVSPNIRQQQFERVIGPIAFHPASVIFDTSSHSALLEKTGVRQLVSDVIDELIELASAFGCTLNAEFKQSTIKEQCQPAEGSSIMWQDYVARRPMEVETFLGSPIKLAQFSGVKLPRIETLYAIFHNLNIVNQTRPKEINGLAPVPGSPTGTISMPRMSSNGPPPPRIVPNGVPMPNGNGMGRPQQRPRNSSNYSGPPPGMRRGPPPGMNGGPPNGYRPPMNGGMNGAPNGMRQPSRRGSVEEDLSDFSHLVMYDEVPVGGEAGYPAENPDLAIRERELQLRQRELALKEQELRMRRGAPGPPGPAGPPGPRRRPPPRNGGGMGPPPGAVYDEDDEEDDYFDPNANIAPMVDPDNFDMMSVTSRKNRSKAPSQSQIRRDPEMGAMAPPARSSRWGRPGFGRNRSSQIIDAVPGLHENILDDPLMSCSSNRYGTVDRGQMHAGSRTNSLTAQHLDALNGPSMAGMNGPFPRRASQSPGNPYSPSIRGGNGRPSPPGMNGRPSPPDGMRQPVPRYPPGQGNSVAPQQVEQRVGVSALQPPNFKDVRSLTGSASGSGGSGESTHLDSEPSAHSSQSSLGPRPPIGVR